MSRLVSSAVYKRIVSNKKEITSWCRHHLLLHCHLLLHVHVHAHVVLVGKGIHRHHIQHHPRSFSKLKLRIVAPKANLVCQLLQVLEGHTLRNCGRPLPFRISSAQIIRQTGCACWQLWQQNIP